ncbi:MULTISPECIES: Imm30 family immunity protein [Bacillus]|uniref:Imm30 family immunity protein n=1 Tax=Bacillus TaxID=1386 RepID=UPI0007A03EE5|nr:MULTISPECIES: Imm30 family immunity protein [Bacillus]KYZ66623.1 hypothetical protein A3782_22525 [Bacillus sp. GZT]MCU5325784.1 Imm30 family immunity protein [Bacillus cereus]MCU5382454.1 Imm30 family immunity protein [Bacillus cereus]MDA1844139.1 Imm30 family immunity protein [Bacillus cereus]MEB5652265.1 Imm30 family immunity protein [Bacillus anthracis]
MSLEKKIFILKRICFLDHEDDSIELFEEILNEILQTADNKVIIDLCSVFHDEIDEPSIVGDLIESIFYIMEKNGVEDGLSKLIEGISIVLPQAKYCAKRFYRSLLVSDDFIIPFINVLKKAKATNKEDVIKILKEISEKQPQQYFEKVDLICKEVI